jgi:hypothetical protein
LFNSVTNDCWNSPPIIASKSANLLFKIDCAIDKLLILSSVVPPYKSLKDSSNVSKIKVAFLEFDAKDCIWSFDNTICFLPTLGSF